MIFTPQANTTVDPNVVFTGTAGAGATGVIPTDDTFGGDDDVVATAPVINAMALHPSPGPLGRR